MLLQEATVVCHGAAADQGFIDYSGTFGGLGHRHFHGGGLLALTTSLRLFKQLIELASQTRLLESIAHALIWLTPAGIQLLHAIALIRRDQLLL